jgi:hypothetical protein
MLNNNILHPQRHKIIYRVKTSVKDRDQEKAVE